MNFDPCTSDTKNYKFGILRKSPDNSPFFTISPEKDMTSQCDRPVNHNEVIETMSKVVSTASSSLGLILGIVIGK
jgi:hypothetical protein